MELPVDLVDLCQGKAEVLRRGAKPPVDDVLVLQMENPVAVQAGDVQRELQPFEELITVVKGRQAIVVQVPCEFEQIEQ